MKSKNLGFIQINREALFNFPWFKGEKYIKIMAFLYLIAHANHKEAEMEIEGSSITLTRGQLGRSIGTLAEDWKRDIKTVRRYLKKFKQHGYISYEPCKRGGRYLTTIITIKVYDEWTLA